jgi:2-polyprenyl-3-methyl-5-hydroxy-6-metoxy-1,4-benzoquinol methylase
MSLDDDYARRLETLASPLWKRVLDVQAPYRWNLRRLSPGYTLDIGCGIGRNLKHLKGRGVGVDPNRACVAAARSAGLAAFTPEEFSAPAETFDSILLSHVLEHVEAAEGRDLIATYLPCLKPGGQVIIITPQEAGYASDQTHRTFLDFASVRRCCEDLNLSVARQYSFPFPRWAGRFFLYNEFVCVARK